MEKRLTISLERGPQHQRDWRGAHLRPRRRCGCRRTQTLHCFCPLPDGQHGSANGQDNGARLVRRRRRRRLRRACLQRAKPTKRQNPRRATPRQAAHAMTTNAGRPRTRAAGQAPIAFSERTLYHTQRACLCTPCLGQRARGRVAARYTHSRGSLLPPSPPPPPPPPPQLVGENA